jgi:molybdenum cofactor cytidylyltransferase
MLAIYDGEPLVQRVMRAAQAATPQRVLVVTGSDAADVANACGDHADRVVFNPNFKRGIGTSIGCGVCGLGPEADGAIIVLADQILVDADHLQNLVRAWSGDSNANVATRFDCRIGPPALFGRDAFSRLAELNADEGALPILQNADFTLSEVTFSAAAFDIDTPEDMEVLAKTHL